jgi:CRISPR/Cas system-associated endoribonuclease Cas2
MAMHQSVLFLISYDIADPKRLTRIHRLLKKQGLPVTVFRVYRGTDNSAIEQAAGGV